IGGCAWSSRSVVRGWQPRRRLEAADPRQPLSRQLSAVASYAALRAVGHLRDPARSHTRALRGLLQAMSTLTSSPAWKSLQAHKPAIEGVAMRELFARDPERFAKMSREMCGLFVDWSKHRATDETMKLLVALAKQADVEGWRAKMFAGEKINVTE